MVRKRAYRASDVNDVRVEELLAGAGAGRVTVGLDVGKFWIYVVIRWSDGQFERPWRVKNPREIGLFVERIGQLATGRELIVAMESTGTYGDAVRGQLQRAGLAIHRVGSKAAHDYAEIFDGVPSQHDGKDAAVVAELTGLGKSTPWPLPEVSDAQAELVYWVDWLDVQQRVQALWLGRLESLLARHWPEATGQLRINSITLLKTLRHYGGPSALSADPDAASRLARWSRSNCKSAKIQNLLAEARGTTGWPQQARDLQRMRQHASSVWLAGQRVERARQRLEAAAREFPVIQRQAAVVGIATACVLWVTLGDPRHYPSGEAYRKAMGLNLKVRSSGQEHGKLKISKRGSALVRKWLYFAAMRMVQREGVAAWYRAKKQRDGGRGKAALIGVARKLALALHTVGAKGEVFEPKRLFPGRPLPPSTPSQAGSTEQSHPGKDAADLVSAGRGAHCRPPAPPASLSLCSMEGILENQFAHKPESFPRIE
jgi:transposase